MSNNNYLKLFNYILNYIFPYKYPKKNNYKIK